MRETDRSDRGHLDKTIDLTDAGQWRTASSGATAVELRAGRRFGRRTEPRMVPQGEKHAYRPGADVTACGRPLGDLHVWDDQPFGDGLLNRGPACLRGIRPGVTAAEPARSVP